MAKWKSWVRLLNIEVDPDRMEESFEELKNQVKKVADEGKYTKVRLKYQGKQVGPEIPLSLFVAAEIFTGFYGGVLKMIIINLGVRSVLEVEFIHAATEILEKGKQFYAEGELDLAEAQYRKAMEMREGDPYAHFHLGVLLRVSGQKEEALKHFMVVASLEDFEFAEKASNAIIKLLQENPTLIQKE
jgi:tetratricopeptide (TPR) repeat protein